MPDADNSLNQLPKRRTREELQAMIDRLAGCVYSLDVTLEQIRIPRLKKYINSPGESIVDS